MVTREQLAQWVCSLLPSPHPPWTLAARLYSLSRGHCTHSTLVGTQGGPRRPGDRQWETLIPAGRAPLTHGFAPA